MKSVGSLLEAVKQCEEERGKIESKGFLFDMDGLLFDTERLFMEQLAVVMKEHGYVLTREIYQETLGLGGEPLVRKMKSYYGEDYPVQELGHIAAERTGIISETVGLVVKPEIRETLAYLQEKGYLLAVASSTKSHLVRKYLADTGLLSHFSEIVGGEMVTKSKPEPEIFQLAAGRLRLKTENCVVLEDSENGVRAGKNAGCRVICVPDLKEPDDEVKAMIDYLVISRM